jgi:hypothetical protein
MGDSEPWDKTSERRILRPRLERMENNEAAFNVEAYKTFHAESLEFMKITWANLQYSVLASGAIMGWLSAPPAKIESEGLARAVAFLPLILTLCFLLLSISAYYAMEKREKIMVRLTTSLGVGPLERDPTSYNLLKFDRRTFMQRTHQIAWLSLIIVDIAFIFLL